MDLEALKEHIDGKFSLHEELDALRHQRADELMENYATEIKDNRATVQRVHSRVDRIETQIKTVKGVGTAIATALGCAAAWIGITKGDL